MDDLGVRMVGGGAVPVLLPVLLMFRHPDSLVTLDVVLTGQEVEEVRPHPAQHRQPVLVPDCPGKQELLGDLLHPLHLHLLLVLLATSHPPQVVERHAAVESLQFSIIIWLTRFTSDLTTWNLPGLPIFVFGFFSLNRFVIPK